MDALTSVEEELRLLDESGLRRQMRAVDGSSGAEMTVDGHHVINFSSNNYLGLAEHPAVVSALREAAAVQGFGSGGSRLISGNPSSHRQLEEALATWLGVDRALIFNSGYQANLGILSALARPGDRIFSDSLNHASLIDGCRLSRSQVTVYPHRDLRSLAEALDVCDSPRKLIVTESLFSMDGDTADLLTLRELAERSGSILIVDDAHAVGLFGAAGTGLAPRHAHLIMGTFGKAFGGVGAYAAGIVSIVELVAQKARSFVFSTSSPALVSAGNQATLDLIRGTEGESRRTALGERVRELRHWLSLNGLAGPSVSHIQPLLIRDPEPMSAMRISNELLASGVFVQGIRPPTVPRGTSRLRISLMATHTREHVDHLVETLSRLKSEFRPWSPT